MISRRCILFASCFRIDCDKMLVMMMRQECMVSNSMKWYAGGNERVIGGRKSCLDSFVALGCEGVVAVDILYV